MREKGGVELDTRRGWGYKLWSFKGITLVLYLLN